MQQTRRVRSAWSAIAVALVVAGIVVSRAGAGEEEPPTPAPVAYCDVDVERCWKGNGAEWWANEARKLERKLWVARQRLAERRARGPARYSPLYAYRLAAVVYGVPEWQLRAVGFCESRHYAFAKNPGSTASGVMQFLDSTWRSTPFAGAGFSVWDPVANVLAAARIVVQDGGWRQWVCKP